MQIGNRSGDQRQQSDTSGRCPPDPTVHPPAHRCPTSGNSPARTHWLFGALGPPTSTPIWCRACQRDAARRCNWRVITMRWAWLLLRRSGWSRLCASAAAPCLSRPVRAVPWSTPLHTDYATRTAQVMGLFDLSPSSAPSREVHERSTAGTSRVNERSADTGAVGHAGPCCAGMAAQRTRHGAGSTVPLPSKATPPYQQGSRGCPRILWAMRRPDRRLTSDLPGPGGDGGPSRSRSKRFGEPLTPRPRQSDPATRPGS